MSLIQIKNNNGPKSYPCATPASKVPEFDKEGRKVGRKERNILFNDALHIFNTVIWHQTYDKGPFR